MKKHTKLIVILTCVCILLVAGGVLTYNQFAAPSLARREIELGERYLDELDYESAILAFDRALKIDPRNVDAYLGKAEALTALGRADEAIAVLREGYNLTQDVRLAEALAGLGVTVEVTAEYPHEKLEIADPNLEAALRDVIDKPEGDLYLDDFKDLRELNLRAADIHDITPIGRLTMLTELGVFNNPITDYTPIASLTGLTELTLAKTDGSVVASLLEALPKVDSLYLISCTIEDLTPITENQTIRYLRIQTCEIADLTPIASASHLYHLSLTDAGLTDASLVAGLTELRSLYLDSNPITDFSGLAGLTNLMTLGLRECGLTDLTAIGSLPILSSLTHLDLYNNEITDITPLSVLSADCELKLNMNKISDWAPVAHVKDVTGRPTTG